MIATFVSWDQRFSEFIELPKGKKLVTLRDAALYITKLPKAEHDAEEWLANPPPKGLIGKKSRF